MVTIRPINTWIGDVSGARRAMLYRFNQQLRALLKQHTFDEDCYQLHQLLIKDYDAWLHTGTTENVFNYYIQVRSKVSDINDFAYYYLNQVAIPWL